jgi:mannonate dehydratase
MMQAIGGAVAQSMESLEAAPADRKWPIEEGPDTPKICLCPRRWRRPAAGGPPPQAPAPARGAGRRAGGGFGGGYGGLSDAPECRADRARGRAGGRGNFNPANSYQRIRQLGVTHLLGVGVGAPGGGWTVESVTRAVQTAKEYGLVAYNSMIGLPSSVIYGRESRSKDMEPFLASIEAAGKGGLAVVEYNFYAHRIIEGYYETVGRAKAGYTAFDFDLELLVDENNIPVQPVYRDENGKITQETLARFPNAKRVKVKDLPPLPQEGAHNLEQMWANPTWFLKHAVPAAEKAGVRLALHPNDPPAPISRGSQQIMGTLAGWKKLVDIV